MSDTMFQEAHDFTVNGGQFSQMTVNGGQVNQTTVNGGQFNHTVNVALGSGRVEPPNDKIPAGIKVLLKASMPDAFHDSGARNPPRCHPGTRLDYIDWISSWGTGTSQHLERILWVQGPAGAGKSAIAQSCAELLAKRKQLGATFFFSRPSRRDNPAYLLPSISYQIATKTPSFNNIIDRNICNDPTLVTKLIAQQFYDLLVKPLEEMKEAREDMKECVIIVDGLDECVGTKAQQEIIEIVAKSVGEATTPFRWAFFSRPESHIIASFTSDHLQPLSLHLELPVSRKIDHEILLYLTFELKKIQKERGLPPSWPSERDLRILVNLSAGLFVYASTVIRFVGERNSQGAMEQLRLVLLLTKQSENRSGSAHPLSELYMFYTLIMQCVPSNILPTVLNVLLLHNTTPKYPNRNEYNKVQAATFCLSLSEDQVQNACGALRSVLKFDSQTIKFYHRSFVDFLHDQDQSKKFYLYGGCLDTARQALLECLNHVHAQYTDNLKLDEIWEPCSIFDERSSPTYRYLANSFFLLCSHPRPLLPLTAAGLVKLQFDTLLRLYYLTPGCGGYHIAPEILRQNLPIELRDKVIRRSHNPILYLSRPSNVAEGSVYYIVGRGKNRVLWWGGDSPRLASYPSSLKFWNR